MKLEDLGYNDRLKKFGLAENLEGFEVGRVISKHKERYIVKTEKGEFEAEITGNLRFSAKSREDFPAVGDWVVLTIYDPDFSIIHKILPRFSIISRQAVSQFGEIQVIAANIDYVLLVQAVDRDFNINRLQRYLTICYASKVSPIIVLTKTDLINEQAKTEIIESIKHADWVIDMGPDGGKNGGEILFEGIPEDLVNCQFSYTGKYLKEIF